MNVLVQVMIIMMRGGRACDLVKIFVMTWTELVIVRTRVHNTPVMIVLTVKAILLYSELIETI